MCYNMSRRKEKNKVLAVLRTDKNAPCIFCNRIEDDELVYGKMYTLMDISCHCFCVLLSSCALQNGTDNQGLFGFLYADIVAEAERGKRYKCSYCGKGGATLGCSVTKCRKQFHLPCGRSRNAVSIFHSNFKSFCVQHAPRQEIPPNIMAKAQERKTMRNKEIRSGVKENTDEDGCVCVMCYTPVCGFPCPESFWPACCARDAWFHRQCIQRMALSAGVHYLKCPLCNDKESFYKLVVSQGFYVPDRDAEWELEQNAFAEIYERPEECVADECKCYLGRKHDADSGSWELKMCLLCGSSAMHTGCMRSRRYVCGLCSQVPMPDLDSFEKTLQAAAAPPPSAPISARPSGPRMPSRMSLRRTKQHSLPRNSTTHESTLRNDTKTTTELSRQELNLKTPVRMNVSIRTSNLNINKDVLTKSKLFSPMKLLDERLQSRMSCMDVRSTDLLVNQLRDKLRRPLPLSIKRKMVNKIFEQLLRDNFSSNVKIEELISPITNSPRKCITNINHKQRKPNSSTDELIVPNEVNATDNEIKFNNALVENKNYTNVNKDIYLTKDHSNDKADNSDMTLAKDAINSTGSHIVDHKISRVSYLTEINEHTELEVTDNADNYMIQAKDAIKATENNIIVTDLVSKVNCLTETDEHTELEVNDAHNCVEIQQLIDENKPNKDDKKEEFQETTNIITLNDHDDFSNSSFELPPEFIADRDSDESLPAIFETPKTLKTVVIEKDSSIEIFKNNESINIDVIKMDSIENTMILKDFLKKSPVKKKQCSLKINGNDKETLNNENVNIDLEIFKSQYLTEVYKSNADGDNENKLVSLEQSADVLTAEANKEILFKDSVRQHKRETVTLRKRKRDERTDLVSSELNGEIVVEESGKDIATQNKYKRAKWGKRKNKNNENVKTEVYNKSKADSKIQNKPEPVTLEQNREKDSREADKGMLFKDTVTQNKRKKVIFRKRKCDENTRTEFRKLQKVDSENESRPEPVTSEENAEIVMEGSNKGILLKYKHQSVKLGKRKYRLDENAKTTFKQRKMNQKLKEATARKRLTGQNSLNSKENKQAKKFIINKDIRDNHTKIKIQMKKDIKSKMNIKCKVVHKNKLKSKNKRLKIKNETPKIFKQTVLNLSPENKLQGLLVKTMDKDITQIKRKRLKPDVGKDNFKQMSLDSFFKTKP